MNKIGLFYGSSTGVTENVALRLAELIGDVDVYDVAKTKPSIVEDYDVLLLGSSTWGSGDLQDDWYDFIIGLEVLNLKGKKIAIFGCGDETMSDTFCGAVGVIYERLQNTGATFIAPYEATEYTFDESPAYIDGRYVGLLLDEVNHADLTDNRLKGWLENIRKEI
ncbi:MAG: flavodoxin [Muribaculaceae bacterium]